ncbi:hypothetical protein MMC28_003134 [Mycoblastus sanguinarius]|nr:hypothetical protein [Mycoblastus sanguinarius]
MKHQIEFLNSVWDTLDAEYQVHQNGVLRVLQGKMQSAISLVDGLHGDAEDNSSMKQVLRKKGDIKRIKYAVRVKKRLSRAIDELKEWQSMFNPSWFLMISVQDRSIDERLIEQPAIHKAPLSTLKNLRDAVQGRPSMDRVKTSSFLSPNDLHLERTPIPFSSAQVARELDESKASVIVDTMLLNPQADIDITTKDVRNLARTLSKMVPFTFGLLNCQGVIKHKVVVKTPMKASPDAIAGGSAHSVLAQVSQLESFEFVFAIPEGLRSPKSLRALLLSNDHQHQLNERFEVAKQLANSVMFVHTSQFVHKNISPETVLLLENGKSVLGMPFLVGFEKFRLADGKTYHIGDSIWQQNLYRYPTRQGVRPGEDYKMQHDIYSLGVCLLEIGVWSSFVRCAKGSPQPEPAPELADLIYGAEKDSRTKAFNIKRLLVSM